MSQIHTEASRIIDARAEKIYAILADYHEGHPAILPKAYFTELTVEKGGIGAGTTIRVGIKVLGTHHTYHMIVSEPEPGRVLVETDINTGQVTTFTVEPLNGGTPSRVTIATELTASPGLAGFMEKLLTPFITRRIFKKELENIADYVRDQ